MTGGRLAAPPAIAIDTNLFSVLLRYFSLESQDVDPAERERQLQKVSGRPDPVSLEQFDSLWQIFERAPRRIVTQHVVAEAFSNKMRKQFNWSSAIRLLPSYFVEERGCCISDVYAHREFQRMLQEIGPTDAGLIYTAEIEKATIISEDGRLRHWAEVREVPTLAVNQLQYLYLR
jgi:hypothetical protein